MTLTVEGWVARPWALHPGQCQNCGAKRSVCWVLDAQGVHWNTACVPCLPRVEKLTVSPGAEDQSIWASIHEIPSLAVSARDPRWPFASGDVEGPEVVIYVRPGQRLKSDVLRNALDNFQSLAAARVWRARNPKDWALEPGEDDRVVAPWDPSNPPRWRKGVPLPLRQTKLRATWRECSDEPHDGRSVIVGKASSKLRKCHTCKAELVAGMTAWRADDSGHKERRCRATYTTHGWSRAGLDLLWCPSCVAAVHTREEAQPEETVVRHMRVIDGGSR